MRAPQYAGEQMLPVHVRRALGVAQLVGAATLLHSAAYSYWATVLAAWLLVVGATAAKRGRAWGVALGFAMAASFAAAFLLEMAPSWFCIVAAAGGLPFALTLRAFTRADKMATVALTALSAALGVAAASAWWFVAWPLFGALPLIRPTWHASIPSMLVGAGLLGIVAAAGWKRRGEAASRSRVSAGEHEAVRVGGLADDCGLEDDLSESDDAVSPHTLRR